MKLIDGIFKYGETVAIDVDGKLIKRKVLYADGEAFVMIDGKRITNSDVSGKGNFNKYAYDQEYSKKNYDRLSVAVKKGTKDRWKQAATDRGMSMNAFIIDSVEKEIKGK